MQARMRTISRAAFEETFGAKSCRKTTTILYRINIGAAFLGAFLMVFLAFLSFLFAFLRLFS